LIKIHHFLKVKHYSLGFTTNKVNNPTHIKDITSSTSIL